MGFAALGLFAIPKMEPALQSPMPSVGIFTAFGEGLPDGAGVLVPASDLLVVNTLAEKPLESLGGGSRGPRRRGLRVLAPPAPRHCPSSPRSLTAVGVVVSSGLPPHAVTVELRVRKRSRC